LLKRICDDEFEELYRLGEKRFHGEKETRSFEKFRSVGRNIASWNEKNRKFLDFCSELFRLAILQNYEQNIWFTTFI
jgi:DNA polymerase-3 subunit delta'